MAAADPLSIATSIIAVASAGIQLSTTLYTYAETVISADQDVKDIARDLSITSTVVTQLGQLLGQDDARQLYCESALVTARSAVEGCDEVFKAIQKELDKILDSQRRGKRQSSMLRRLKWPLVEPRLHKLQVRLERLKNTLVLALNAVTYANEVAKRQTRSVRPISQQPRYKTSEQSLQIERLISMNEQANRRSYGLETAIRKIGIMPAHGAILASSNIDDDDSSEREAEWPTDRPASASDFTSTVSLVSNRPNEDTMELTLEVPHPISGQDLDDMTDQVRLLLKVLEDARSSNNHGVYPIDRQICLELLQVIRSCLAPGTKQIRASHNSGRNQSSIIPPSGKEEVQFILQQLSSTMMSSDSKSTSIVPPHHDEVFISLSKPRTSLTGDTFIA